MEKADNAIVNVVAGIMGKAEANAQKNDGDYEVDGLLHCGKCGTPKQVRVILFGKEQMPYCLCKCETQKRDERIAEMKRRDRQLEINKMRRIGFPESEMSRWTFSMDDGANEKMSNIAHKFVENFDEMVKRKKGLLLFGDVGTGKTFYAACIANALIDRGHPCLVTDFSRLVNTISGMYDGKQDYIDGLNRFDLLVIDDLARERDTEYMNEIVQTIIDSRYRSGLPVIITTNLTAEEIKDPADIRKKRTYSRLLEMCVPIHVEGTDRRRQKLKNDYGELKDMLGL